MHGSIGSQVRGSFPLYWSQQGGKLGKPDILLQNFDPLFSATRSHFADMQVPCPHAHHASPLFPPS